jgi:DNA-binding transcriptional MerR regulator
MQCICTLQGKGDENTMKMKEICKRTGLTERTVRYYVEEGLIDPPSMVRSRREYREYSEQDVEQLLTIAALRKLFFTIDEIKDMQQQPERITEVLSAYKLKLATDAKAKAAIVDALEQLNLDELRDIDMIAIKLKPFSEKLPLPQRDINPNFGRFETGTKADREREYELFQKRQARKFKLGKYSIIAIAVINVLMALLAFYGNGNLLTLTVQVVFSICLFLGVTWVRYLFAVGAALSTLANIPLLLYSVDAGDLLIVIFYAFYFIYSAVTCVLLFKSEAISEFLYAQKNG